ncbi:MAG: LacI family DNA-binding transcriptional regulator [Coprobacillaceae bacterium]
MARVTIKDIAEKAGVSKTIVSHYLNDNFKFMSEDTKNKIARIVKETNYIPKNSARNLKFKKVKVIQIIVANISSLFSTNIIKYIDRKVSSSTIQVIVSYSDDNDAKERNLIEQAISSDVDGIILFPTGANSDHYQMLYDKNIPIVYVDRIPEGVNHYYCALLDNDKAISEAITLLASKGHKRIAYLGLPLQDEITPRIERLNAFRKSISHYDDISPFIISGVKESLGDKIAELLKRPDYTPTAFIASNETCLEILLKERKKKNHTSQIDIVSIDGYEIYTYINDIVLTIEHPTEEICNCIIDCLGVLKNDDEVKIASDKTIIRFDPIFISES